MDWMYVLFAKLVSNSSTVSLLPAAAGDGPRVPDVQCGGLLVRLPHHLRNGAEPALSCSSAYIY